MKHYKLYIGGSGAEVCWQHMTRHQYAFWSSMKKIELEKHIFGETPFDTTHDADLGEIPSFAKLINRDIMHWCDLDNAGHEHYCNIEDAWLKIVEQNDDNDNVADYQKKSTKKNRCHNIINMNNILKDSLETGLNLIVYNEEPKCLDEDSQYLQIFSSETGTFFSTTITLDDKDEFDIYKLRIRICNALNEKDVKIESIYYDDILLKTDSILTRGRDIEVYLINK